MDEVHISTLSFKLKSHPDPRGLSQRIIPKLQVFPLRRKKEHGFALYTRRWRKINTFLSRILSRGRF